MVNGLLPLRKDKTRSGEEEDKSFGSEEYELLDCGDEMSSLKTRRTMRSSTAMRMKKILALVGAAMILAKMGGGTSQQQGGRQDSHKILDYSRLNMCLVITLISFQGDI